MGIEAIRKNPELWKQKYKGRQSTLPEIAAFIQRYKEMHPSLKASQLRTLIGEEYYTKRKKKIKPIAQATYYKALKWLQKNGAVIK
jgi:hypothetical protein